MNLGKFLKAALVVAKPSAQALAIAVITAAAQAAMAKLSKTKPG